MDKKGQQKTSLNNRKLTYESKFSDYAAYNVT